MSVKVSLIADIYRLLESPRFDDGEIFGEIILTPDNHNLLSQLDNNDLLYPHITIDDDTFLLNDLNIDTDLNKRLIIQLIPPRSQNEYVAQNIDELLANRREAFYKIPSAFYIADVDYLHGDENKPDKIKKYLETIKFVSMLVNISDYSDYSSGNLNLIFLGKGKQEIPISYSTDNLSSLEELTELNGLVFCDPHQDQKITILKSVVYELLKPVSDKGERFKFLLNNFKELHKRFINNYDLFVSEFSFEKIREEVEERKLEYTIKINNIFSDIQNKLLTIPVALIVVGAQMENTGEFSLKNAVILGGAIVFAILMSLLLKNQNHTLKAINFEVNEQKIRLKNKYSAIAEKFNSSFQYLDDRFKSQVELLSVVSIFVWVGLVCSVILFIIYTPALSYFFIPSSYGNSYCYNYGY